MLTVIKRCYLIVSSRNYKQNYKEKCVIEDEKVRWHSGWGTRY